MRDTYTTIHSNNSNRSIWRTSGAGMRRTTVKNKTSIIWNGISKGKYKLSFHLWVGMWVRKKKLKDTYTTIHSNNSNRSIWRTSGAGMRRTTVKNKTSIIWNGISKGKYKLSFHLWVGMWVRKKKLKDTYTTIHSQFN